MTRSSDFLPIKSPTLRLILESASPSANSLRTAVVICGGNRGVMALTPESFASSFGPRMSPQATISYNEPERPSLAQFTLFPDEMPQEATRINFICFASEDGDTQLHDSQLTLTLYATGDGDTTTELFSLSVTHPFREANSPLVWVVPIIQRIGDEWHFDAVNASLVTITFDRLVEYGVELPVG